MKQIDRRTFTASVAAGIVGTSAEAAREPVDVPVGPMVGHVSATSANLWYRPAAAGKYTLRVRSKEGAPEVRVVGNSTDEHDRCVTWRIEGLKPATRYQYNIHSPSKTLVAGKDYYFETAPKDGRDSRVCLAFGSCAHNKPLPLWTQIADRGSQGLVLLGDTPYIDSTDLATARRKHRGFLLIPQLAAVARHMPLWGTRDDHDFGRKTRMAASRARSGLGKRLSRVSGKRIVW